MYLEFQNVGFTHQDGVQPLFTGLAVSFGPGWTGVVGANGVGKTTLLELACGLLTPELGRVLVGGRALLCPQRTDQPPALLQQFLEAQDGEARRLHGQLALSPIVGRPWETLSHGERKRAQIGVALWQAPEILALDEPTNHIDAAARHLLQQALAGFRGLGLLVSHDLVFLKHLVSRRWHVEAGRVASVAGPDTAVGLVTGGA